MSHALKYGISSASYIHEIVTELQIMAGNNNLRTLSYLLGQCALEASLIAKQDSILNCDEIVNSTLPETNQKQFSP